MNKYIKAISDLDLRRVDEIISKDAKWLSWFEASLTNVRHGADPEKKNKDSLSVRELAAPKDLRRISNMF